MNRKDKKAMRLLLAEQEALRDAEKVLSDFIHEEGAIVGGKNDETYFLSDDESGVWLDSER